MGLVPAVCGSDVPSEYNSAYVAVLRPLVLKYDFIVPYKITFLPILLDVTNINDFIVFDDGFTETHCE